MSVGFRKSLFGFNCDDVLSYIEKMHKAHTEKEIVLKEQIGDLEAQNVSLKEQISDIAKEKAEIEAQLKEFTDKYDEIERLSQNIGKLYLVAKSNAQSIMKEAETSAEIARKEVLRNIASIDGAQKSLNNVKEDVVNTSAEFAKEIAALSKSLNDARYQIEAHETAVTKSEEEYRQLIKVLSDE